MKGMIQMLCNPKRKKTSPCELLLQETWTLLSERNPLQTRMNQSGRNPKQTWMIQNGSTQRMTKNVRSVPTFVLTASCLNYSRPKETRMPRDDRLHTEKRRTLFEPNSAKTKKQQDFRCQVRTTRTLHGVFRIQTKPIPTWTYFAPKETLPDLRRPTQTPLIRRVLSHT